MEVLKVSTKSNPNSVAGALAAIIKEKDIAEIQAVGAGAINQAIKAIAIASFNPKVEEDSKPAPIAKPSGKLCIAKPIAIIKPVFKRLFPCKLL